MMAETTTVALPDLDTAPPNLAPHADTAHALAAASIAPNTRRAYTAVLGRLDTMCGTTFVCDTLGFHPLTSERMK